MTSFRVRPRFQKVSAMTPEEIQERIRRCLRQPGAPCVGRMIPGHIVLSVPEADLHFWSPQLSLSVEACDEGALIRGLYGPAPAIWLLFAFGYGILAFLMVIVTIVGLASVSLGISAPVLWALPVLGGGLATLYVAAQMGQKIGAEQTFTLHHFLEEAIDEKISVR